MRRHASHAQVHASGTVCRNMVVRIVEQMQAFPGLVMSSQHKMCDEDVVEQHGMKYGNVRSKEW